MSVSEKIYCRATSIATSGHIKKQKPQDLHFSFSVNTTNLWPDLFILSETIMHFSGQTETHKRQPLHFSELIFTFSILLLVVNGAYLIVAV